MKNYLKVQYEKLLKIDPPYYQSSNSSSPYMTKIIGKIKKKVTPTESKANNNIIIKELRPNTTKLERPSHANLDLPQINVKPQIVISKSLSRHLKLKNKIKKTIEETKKEPEIRINLLGKQTKTKQQQALNLAPKDKVPEPCKSCGRSDFPERLHTHHENNNKSSPTKKNKPWLSPKSNQKSNSRPRALSLDCSSGVVEPLALTAANAESTASEQLGKNTLVGSQQQNKKQEVKQMQKSVKGSMVR